MIKIIRRLNKVQRLSLAVLVFVLLCKLGGLTGAWFMSKDSVTNVFGIHDYFLDIVLTEPNWTSVGSTQASKMQPGMDIFKDPRVTNITEDSCFVRMKIIVADSSGETLNMTTEQKDAILSAIAYCTSDGGTASVADDTFNKYENLNPKFKKDGDWYYYMDGNDCAILKSGESTEPLFTDVLIPSKKSEYTYFESGFVITIVAEAVYTGGLTDKSIASVAQRFDGNDDEDSEEVEEENSEISLFSVRDSSASDSAVMTAVSHAGFGANTVVPAENNHTNDNTVSGAGVE